MERGDKYLNAYRAHRDAANAAHELFRSYCPLNPPPVPGMDTAIRLAWRIKCGCSIEEAAGREYLYRWNLAIKPSDQVLGAGTVDPACSIFGVPHTIGM